MGCRWYNYNISVPKTGGGGSEKPAVLVVEPVVATFHYYSIYIMSSK